jgi:hypothetical protein
MRWKVLDFIANEVLGLSSMLQAISAIRNVVWYTQK